VIEDGSVNSKNTTIWNGEVGYRLSSKARFVLEAFNLFDPLSTKSESNPVDHAHEIRVERLVPRAEHQPADWPEIDQRERVRVSSLANALFHATVREPDRARRLAVAERMAALHTQPGQEPAVRESLARALYNVTVGEPGSSVHFG
jgi:hypothetical protein